LLTARGGDKAERRPLVGAPVDAVENAVFMPAGADDD
jgi:hypothetical protein